MTTQTYLKSTDFGNFGNQKKQDNIKVLQDENSILRFMVEIYQKKLIDFEAMERRVAYLEALNFE